MLKVMELPYGFSLWAEGDGTPRLRKRGSANANLPHEYRWAPEAAGLASAIKYELDRIDDDVEAGLYGNSYEREDAVRQMKGFELSFVFRALLQAWLSLTLEPDNSKVAPRVRTYGSRVMTALGSGAGARRIGIL